MALVSVDNFHKFSAPQFNFCLFRGLDKLCLNNMATIQDVAKTLLKMAFQKPLAESQTD